MVFHPKKPNNMEGLQKTWQKNYINISRQRLVELKFFCFLNVFFFQELKQPLFFIISLSKTPYAFSLYAFINNSRAFFVLKHFNRSLSLILNNEGKNYFCLLIYDDIRRQAERAALYPLCCVEKKSPQSVSCDMKFFWLQKKPTEVFYKKSCS